MGKAYQDTPGAIDSIRFTVGRDDSGCWVVCDRDGIVGGLFKDRASAVHFAMFESDHAPAAVCCVPDGVIGRRSQTPQVVPALHLVGGGVAGTRGR